MKVMSVTTAMARMGAGFGLIALLAATPARAIEWASVQGKAITLFYPGQSPLEWEMTPSDHSGADKFRGGKNCDQCHDGEEKLIGDKIVSGAKNEPTPIPGKPGWVVATVKVAHDATNFYVHLDFVTNDKTDSKQDPKFDTKVTMMLTEGKVAEATRAGCFAACHDDLSDMPSANGATRTKYLMRSRVKMTRQGGGDAMKPDEDLARMRADGQVLEYWQAELNPGAPAQSNSYSVLEKRAEIKPNAVTAEAVPANGGWSVTLTRKLHAGADYKDLDPGKPYTVGFAIHSGHAARRFHFVSFEHSLVLDQGTADLVAAAQ